MFKVNGNIAAGTQGVFSTVDVKKLAMQFGQKEKKPPPLIISQKGKFIQPAFSQNRSTKSQCKVPILSTSSLGHASSKLYSTLPPEVSSISASSPSTSSQEENSEKFKVFLEFVELCKKGKSDPLISFFAKNKILDRDSLEAKKKRENFLNTPLDEQGNVAIFYMATGEESSNYLSIKKLLFQGANVNATNIRRQNILHVLVEQQKYPHFSEIANFAVVDPETEWLYSNETEGSLKEIINENILFPEKNLIEKGKLLDLKALDENGDTSLHIACRVGNIEAVDAIWAACVTKKIEPEMLRIKNQNKETIIDLAAKSPYQSIRDKFGCVPPFSLKKSAR